MAALPAPRRPGVDHARQRVVVDPRGWMRPAEDVPALPSVVQAVWADRRLRLRYRPGDSDGERGYTVDPYGLVSKAGVWYLIAAHRGAARLFRLSRVRTATILPEMSSRPAELDLDALWERLRRRAEARGSGLDVRLRVRADRREIVLRVCRAQLVGAPPRIEEDVEAGQVLISATFRDLLPARGALLGFGTDVEVIAPDELRRAMATTARAVAELYG